MLANILTPPLPVLRDNRLIWSGLYGSSASLAISNLALTLQKPLLLLVPDMPTLDKFARELHFFAKDHHYPILHFPDRETLPYDHFSPHEDLISQRLLVLSKINQLQRGIVIAALSSIMYRLPPNDYLLARSFSLACDDVLDLNSLQQRLTMSGYRHVAQVLQHGEFTSRGAILDVFPMGSQLPLRIEWFDNTIASIRTFDPETQRSIEKISAIEMLPAREYPLDETGIAHFREKWREQFSGNPMESPLYKAISRGEAAAGAEYYLPLFFDNTATFFDYLPENTQLLLSNNLQPQAQLFYDEVKKRYQQLRYDTSKPICEPRQIALSVEELYGTMQRFPQIILSHKEHAPVTFNTQPPPNLTVNPKLHDPLAILKNFITTQNHRLLFCTESAGRREVLLNLLQDAQIFPHHYSDWQAFLQDNQRLGITIAPIDDGLWIENPNIALITESQLFGEQVQQRRLRKKKKIDPDAMIRHLAELHIGAPIVHIDHGVGHYQGLQVIQTGDVAAEYLTLEYRDGDKIYVPVSSLHLISRYTGADASLAPIARLGNNQWKKTKEKALKRIHDIAAELLDLYSRRQATPGFAFQPPDADFQAFRAAFPFEETPDQTAAIHAVIDDMTAPRSMDRLVCGDVGFGKTEVAMQAAFLAVQSNKQVAVLVPTTLLATQHAQTFQDRFANWPVKIAALSRLSTTKETKNILDDLANGKIDIIIGTHKLLQDSIRIKDLGLLIIDEEHRFGVRQKERIKSLRAHVDILTLTATPIPRTLNMALAGTRDLSFITTPPAKRLAVKTFVAESEPTLIREAILREIMRGGQTYYLHNDIATIHATAEKIKNIVPDAEVVIAHGQLRERELEHVMSDFYHRKFNVLVCTTIIESGIDIPTANTIIIDRADRFGLSQLHQLRGRVGRSHHQAYAYLLTPPPTALTADAEKRLNAISNLEDLGAGFRLATHDLEIRGAGELLGEEQSGHLEEIGFTLYLTLLEEAVSALKAGVKPSLEKTLAAHCEIDLHISALIPEDYVADIYTRLSLYKRLADCKTKIDIEEMTAELVDRFGPLPEALKTLLAIHQLRLLADNLGISKIDVGQSFGYLHFKAQPNIDPLKIIHLIQRDSSHYQLQGSDKLRFKFSGKPEERIAAVMKVITSLS